MVMKTQWFAQRFHENLIRGETEKAILLQVPSTCRLGRWKFYHPIKLTIIYTTILEIRFPALFKDHEFTESEV